MTPKKLRKPSHGNVADQCRWMGLRVGDFIEATDEDSQGVLCEYKMRLLYLGRAMAIFDKQYRHRLTPNEWRGPDAFIPVDMRSNTWFLTESGQ